MTFLELLYVVGDCADFGDCSAVCGGGFQTCERTCHQGNFGDEDCPNDDKLKWQICNTQPCGMYILNYSHVIAYDS